MRDTPSSFQHVDTHCHVDLFPKPEAIVAEVIERSICTIAVTNAPFLFPNTLQLAKKTPLLLPALGMHPELVKSHGNQLDQFLQFLPTTRFVGEVGLDYVTKDEADRREQRRVFETIVNACDQASNKVLTIHSRRSASDVIAILGGCDPGAVILHWYSGSLRDLGLALSAGYYFSVNVAMIRSENGQRIIRELPLNRILTETDGPFAKHDNQPATPSTVALVIDQLSDILNMTPDEVRIAVKKNAEDVLCE